LFSAVKKGQFAAAARRQETSPPALARTATKAQESYGLHSARLRRWSFEEEEEEEEEGHYFFVCLLLA